VRERPTHIASVWHDGSWTDTACQLKAREGMALATVECALDNFRGLLCGNCMKAVTLDDVEASNARLRLAFPDRDPPNYFTIAQRRWVLYPGASYR
jgi:hypothetical protein